MSENIGLNIVGANKYLLDEYVYVTLVNTLGNDFSNLILLIFSTFSV